MFIDATLFEELELVEEDLRQISRIPGCDIAGVLDPRHNFNGSIVYNPTVKLSSGLASAILNNNQVAVLMQFNSGLPFNIRANTVSPGWVMTERQKKLWLTPEGDKQMDALQCLKGRLQPEDLANMVLFLASEDAKMITSQNLVVDAGWT